MHAQTRRILLVCSAFLGALTLDCAAAALFAPAPAAQITDDEARNSGPGHPWQGGPEPVNPWSFALNTAIPLIEWTAHDDTEVAFGLHHCSQAASTNGHLGPKWQHSYDTHLERWTDPGGVERCALLWGDHRIQLFSQSGAAWLPDDGYRDRLAAAGTGFIVTLKGRRQFVFGPSRVPSRFRLDRIIDRSGNVVDLSYELDDRLVAISDGTGRRVQLIYDSYDLRYVDFRFPGGSQTWTILFTTTWRNDTILWPAVTPHGTVTTRIAYSGDGRRNIIQFRDRVLGIWRYGYSGDDLIWVQAPANSTTERTQYAKPSAADRVVTDPTGVARTYKYDALFRLLQSDDALGQRTEVLYADVDYAWAPSRVTRPSGTFRRYDHDARGNVVGVFDEGGLRWDYAYDAHDNVLLAQPPRVTDAWGNRETGRRRTEFVYDSLDRLVEARRFRDVSNYDVTAFAYDARGDVTTITDANGGVSTLAHNGYGNLTRLTTPAGRTCRWKFEAGDTTAGFTVPNAFIDGTGQRGDLVRDEWGRLVQELFPDGSGRTYEYDPLSRLTRVVDALGGVTSLKFARQGWLEKVGTPSGTLRYDHLANGLVASTTELPAAGPSRTRVYSYDAVNRLVQLDDGNGPMQFTYDVDGRCVDRTTANGARTSWTYDAGGHVVRLEHFDAASVSFARYDQSWQENGLLRSVVETDAFGPVTVQYGYDFLNRLVRELRTGGAAYDGQWGYDALGTRIAEIENGSTTTYTYDADQRLLATSGASSDTYTWDANGRLVERDRQGTRHRFAYDFAGRLTGIDHDQGAGYGWLPIATYRYDGLGRRSERQTWVSGAPAELHQFLHDHGVVVRDVVTDWGSSVTNDWNATWGFGVAGLRDIVNPGAASHPATDERGSIRGASDDSGYGSANGAMHNAFGKVIYAGANPLDLGFAADRAVRDEGDAGLLFAGDGFYDPVVDMALPSGVGAGLVTSQDWGDWKERLKRLQDLIDKIRDLDKKYWDKVFAARRDRVEADTAARAAASARALPWWDPKSLGGLIAAYLDSKEASYRRQQRAKELEAGEIAKEMRELEPEVDKLMEDVFSCLARWPSAFGRLLGWK